VEYTRGAVSLMVWVANDHTGICALGARRGGVRALVFRWLTYDSMPANEMVVAKLI
jgi:hypothetical protein